MTDVALKEYLERLIQGEVSRLETELRAQKENVSLASNAANKALDKAESALTRRLEAMNELRTQLQDQAQTFAREDLVASRINALADRGSRLESFQNRMVGALLVVPMVTSILVGLVLYFVTK